MGLKLVKEAGVDQIPIFQKEFEVAQGGFLLDTTGLPSGELVTPGTPVGFDEKTRKVNVLKTAKLYENSVSTDVAATLEVTIESVEFTITAKASDADNANGIVFKFVDGTEGVAWNGNTLTVTLTTDRDDYDAADLETLIQSATEGCPAGFSVDEVEVSGEGTPDLGDVELNEEEKFSGGKEAQDLKLVKGHFLKVGEYVAATVGGAAYAISAIDTSNDNYDLVTLETALGVALSVGDVIFKSSATGETDGALHVTPKGLLFDNVKVEDNVTCAVVLRGTVYKKRVVNGIHSEVENALPLIIFSESY
jgi:hypothetical protein